MSKSTKRTTFKEDPPPIFQSWNQMYVFVLVLHTIIISLFYLLTKAYS
ncbi:MAG: hypothetical protein AAGJ18_17400 [Bacteroidota bacterium]